MKARIPDNQKNQTHPKSVVGKTLELYRLLDQKSVASTSTCPSNCADCCYDYFYITQNEYYTIVYYCLSQKPKVYLQEIVNKAHGQLRMLERVYPAEYTKLNTVAHYKQLDPYIHLLQDKQIIKEMLPEPCIFLTKENKCDIYPVRPYVCRYHGTFSHSICEKANNSYGIELAQDIMMRVVGSNLKGNQFVRPYPIMDWFGSILPFDLQDYSGRLEPTWCRVQ